MLTLSHFEKIAVKPFMLREFRNSAYAKKLMQHIAEDVTTLFEISGAEMKHPEIDLHLWDYGKMIKAGVNYSNHKCSEN